MATNKDFRLSKETKRILSSLPTSKRGHWKGMMIQAEVSEKNAKMAKVREPKGE